MIIFFKNIKKIGGPSSFQKKFIEWLKKNKIEYDFLKKKNIFKKKILFINSGTFNILLLFVSSLFRTKIVQRLNGFYDLKKVKNKYYLRCFLINFSMQLIRKYMSDYIIYQSKKSKTLWDKNFGKVKKKYSIIHNPSFNNLAKLMVTSRKRKFFNLVIVEGNIEDNTYNNKLFEIIYNISNRLIAIRKVYIFGNVQKSLKKKLLTKKKIIIKNTVSHDKLKKFYHKNNLIFFGIEYNPSCSNSIIEANSFGIPSITLNTGSYRELIKNSGIQVNYKNIFSKNLDFKILNSLKNIMKNYEKFSRLSLINSKKFHPDYIFANYLKCFKKSYSDYY